MQDSTWMIGEPTFPLDMLGNPGERVVVWGAGELGRRLMDCLGERGLCFIDRSPLLRGTVVAERAVHGSDALALLDWDAVWIAARSNPATVRNRLLAMGLRDGAGFLEPYAWAPFEAAVEGLEGTMELLRRVDWRGREVLEVGAGGHPFLALCLLWCGADTVHWTDCEPSPGALAMGSWEFRQGLEFLRVLAQHYGSDRRGDDSPFDLLGRLRPYGQTIDAQRLPFAEGSLDAVVSRDTLEFIDDPALALREFARVLRPGGRMLACDLGLHDRRCNDPQAMQHPWTFLGMGAAQWSALGPSLHLQNRWRARDYGNAMDAAGFEILHRSSRVDEGLTATMVEAMDAEFREGYTRSELSELDLTLLGAVT